MDIKSKKTVLSGSIVVPGSKSHTIRALILAAMAEGISTIKNPLSSADCRSAAASIPLMGASVSFGLEWVVKGAGKNLHLPDDVVNVGNSGSTLYFLAPLAACFDGWSVFTGDESIRRRPVLHLSNMLEQAGAQTALTHAHKNAPPLLIKGSIKPSLIKTDGRLSQYITGMMLAATRLDGKTTIELSDPKETPYLTMTKQWLEKMGIPVSLSSDFKKIEVSGPKTIKAFDCTIPSDWEAVAFPLVAALISNSSISIENVDVSGSQGDDAVIDIVRAIGADITLFKDEKKLIVNGGNELYIPSDTVQKGRFFEIREGVLYIEMGGFPDAICALAVLACFINGKTVFTDIAICRQKETDRIKVMESELLKLGAGIKDCGDTLEVNGRGLQSLHGSHVESFFDHRVAMSLCCAGFGLKDGDTLIVCDAECAAVSFPHFIETMNALGADIESLL